MGKEGKGKGNEGREREGKEGEEARGEGAGEKERGKGREGPDQVSREIDAPGQTVPCTRSSDGEGSVTKTFYTLLLPAGTTRADEDADLRRRREVTASETE